MPKDKLTVYGWLCSRLPNDMRPRLRQEYSKAGQRGNTHAQKLFMSRMHTSTTVFTRADTLTRSSILMWLFDNSFGELVYPRSIWMGYVRRLQREESIQRNKDKIKNLKAANKRLVHDLLGERVLDEP